jgi:hypothetical protein
MFFRKVDARLPDYLLSHNPKDHNANIKLLRTKIQVILLYENHSLLCTAYVTKLQYRNVSSLIMQFKESRGRINPEFLPPGLSRNEDRTASRVTKYPTKLAEIETTIMKFKLVIIQSRTPYSAICTQSGNFCFHSKSNFVKTS